jgi:hypothetical protein
VVLNRPEQIEDVHLLATPDVLIQGRGHSFFLGSVMANLAGFFDQAIAMARFVGMIHLGMCRLLHITMCNDGAGSAAL